MTEYLARAIRDTQNSVHRLNACFCLSKISFNDSSLDKLTDYAEDIRSRLLED